jgi:hypothetical protein
MRDFLSKAKRCQMLVLGSANVRIVKQVDDESMPPESGEKRAAEGKGKKETKG